ncbi:MAG: hypothetical protein IPO22_24625 [Anaerolineales bacterium]|nr:hypothetical protein [Anaerolineales bacterium]
MRPSQDFGLGHHRNYTASFWMAVLLQLFAAPAAIILIFGGSIGATIITSR